MRNIVLRFLRQRFVPILSFASILLITSAFAFGQREKLLYSFGVDGIGDGDGDYPQASLTADPEGNLYGTTYYGGAYNLGTVFELSPPPQKGGSWTETILHSFQGGDDGELPASAVILDKSGNVYGATTTGGANGLGVVYELIRPSQIGGAWTESLIYSFADTRSGTTGNVGGGVVFAKGGLFVVTLHGGNGFGNVFELRPPLNGGGQWHGGQVFAFSGGAGGGSPLTGGGALIADADGNLYGTAFNGTGIVFELSPPSDGTGPWTETVLASLESGPLVSSGPLVFDQAGNLYGTASPISGIGTGVVFELSPPFSQGDQWAEKVVYSFSSSDAQAGYNPYGGLIFDNAGNLYGVTFQGGSAPCNCGTVFKLTPGSLWTETVLRSFSGPTKDGSFPRFTLTADSAGHIYGTTANGGAYGSGTSVGGTAFQIIP